MRRAALNFCLSNLHNFVNSARKMARAPPSLLDGRGSSSDEATDMGLGCVNAKTLNCDRRTCSSKTVLVAQHASGFNLEIELKNIILRRVSIFEFLHSQGHQQTLKQRTFDVRSSLSSGRLRAPRDANAPNSSHGTRDPEAHMSPADPSDPRGPRLCTQRLKAGR
jgi:hypothetical protein